MSVGCAMRTMNQPLATSFRCARRTLHMFFSVRTAHPTHVLFGAHGAPYTSLVLRQTLTFSWLVFRAHEPGIIWTEDCSKEPAQPLLATRPISRPIFCGITARRWGNPWQKAGHARVGCAMRTMNQQHATSFRCARRTLHWFIELIRASLADWRVS